jgi:threonyl-tRNA synthetase
LERIEQRMKEIIQEDQPFERVELSKDEARQLFRERGEPYKVEILDEIEEDTVTVYRNADKWLDLCRGPHLPSTGRLRAIKLLSSSGAYWRGDERNRMLQRIYGTAYDEPKALEEHLRRLEEAARRDHRKLGRQLELFTFLPEAPASPFFFPKGARVYNLLIEYVRDLYDRYGYEEVITPQILTQELWEKSGHYENYREYMYFTAMEGREFAIKPMNCPAHALMYATRRRSYRELPIRYADFGRLHRAERSGVVQGLTRVRSFSQDDAHIFCRPDQIEAEVHTVIEMILETYRLFGFTDLEIELSTRPEKAIGSEALWRQAETALAQALEAKGLEYALNPGEGAFYGPKIDFIVHDALGRAWQLGTIQLDFNLPERFDLTYIQEDSTYARPVMIHRAMLGSIERFMGILIEHCAGAFPFWLAPVQVVLLPIADRHQPYAEQVAERLRAEGFRVEVDGRRERVQHKIAEAEGQKVPYMLIVGDREAASGQVAVRQRGRKDLGPMPLEAFLERIRAERWPGSPSASPPEEASTS